MNGVHFYLITVDVGNKVWDNFGHTALRMYDESSNTDLMFNWGVFDVSGGVVAFSYNFLNIEKMRAEILCLKQSSIIQNH